LSQQKEEGIEIESLKNQVIRLEKELSRKDKLQTTSHWPEEILNFKVVDPSGFFWLKKASHASGPNIFYRLYVTQLKPNRQGSFVLILDDPEAMVFLLRNKSRYLDPVSTIENDDAIGWALELKEAGTFKEEKGKLVVQNPIRLRIIGEQAQRQSL